jgi:hypothetical protein
MKGFQNYLDAKEIGEHCGRAVWKLDAPLRFVLNPYVIIEAPAGFETDLASVPRVPFIYDLWGNKAHREAVIHDLMYRIDATTVQGKPISKEDADWYFRCAMISSNPDVRKNPQPYYIYQPRYLAVRTCGDSSFHKMKIGDSFPLD